MKTLLLYIIYLVLNKQVKENIVKRFIKEEIPKKGKEEHIKNLANIKKIRYKKAALDLVILVKNVV